MNKYVTGIAAALAAAVTLTLTACGTPTEPVAVPSSSASATGSAVSDRDARRAAAEVGERELAIYGALGLPSTTDRIAAEAAAARGFPYLFSHGQGCSWVRTWDAKLWRLYGSTNGGALVRDDTAEQAFHSSPGASDLWTCNPAEDIPAADDPTASTPYRWTDERGTWVRVASAVYLVPAEIPTRGVVPHLRSESGEVVPLPTN